MSGENAKIDPGAVADLYKRYASDLQAFLLGMLKDHDLVNEVVQATFVKALESGHTADSKTIKGWLFRVAHNEAMTIKRRHAVSKKTVRKIAEKEIFWQQTAENQVNAAEDGFAQLSRTETIKEVRSALKQLSDVQQQMIRMRIYEQKTFAVIAKELGIPIGTALTRMRRAISKLSEILKSENTDH